jgi:Tfp pilus assembly protein PilO
MTSSSPLIWILLLLALALVVVLWFLHIRSQSQHRQELAQSKRDIETLKQTVGALCSSAVGVDKRVNRLERQGRDLEERQEHIEQQSQSDEPPYTDAIRMVQDGAGPEQLVSELGISRDAADLIIMMHGVK